ncbi:hypothetical protein [Amorphus orientalis]|uniref:DUF4189 domain-containing protein n=1 Tax=Amorphus orientalis TaxID=649198 RepID=A0AAE4ASS2_9HYPH|nr:hypothetical protein [Amorphus orientalis]MDQ0314264.1 hypothetical protein [Amorphus orientalis]
MLDRAMRILTLLAVVSVPGAAVAEYSYKPAQEVPQRVYPEGSGSIQNSAPLGYAAMAVGPAGRSWIIGARSEADARQQAQQECSQFGDNCQAVASGTDRGYFVGGYCGDTPKAAYSTIDFLDAQDRFYGYALGSRQGFVEQDGDCRIDWLGHRVMPTLDERPTLVSGRR